VNKYLIFRTDRIGDFLVSAILLKCIKINDPNSNITIIASKKNYSYIKTFPYVDQVIQLDNKFFSKIILLIQLIKIKYTSIIIQDNKKRSKFISFFLQSIYKINIKDTEKISHINIIKNILKKINFKYYEDSLNIFSHVKINKSNHNNLIQLHFDEKWIYNDYIKKFINIEPTENELLKFIKELIKNGNKMLITTGLVLPTVVTKIKPVLEKLNIKIYEGLSFTQLEMITSKSSVLISCHGAISHLAAAYNIKQIDIIDKSYDYNKWTDHFRNYKSLHRINFNNLSSKILELL
jgi:ADP-heptose:LPS heptosyltransferase